MITPHGGQQGSLFLKRSGVTVVVVSPEALFIEYYQFLAHKIILGITSGETDLGLALGNSAPKVTGFGK